MAIRLASCTGMPRGGIDMRMIVFLAAALGAFGFATPSMAGPGQCFDAYGRPASPVYNTDAPPYALMCAVLQRGGSCTGVDPIWAQSNCGFGPRYYRYNNQGYPRYWNRYDRYDYYDYHTR
jgi:hypothetical protein